MNLLRADIERIIGVSRRWALSWSLCLCQMFQQIFDHHLTSVCIFLCFQLLRVYDLSGKGGEVAFGLLDHLCSKSGSCCTYSFRNLLPVKCLCYQEDKDNLIEAFSVAVWVAIASKEFGVMVIPATISKKTIIKSPRLFKVIFATIAPKKSRLLLK